MRRTIAATALGLSLLATAAFAATRDFITLPTGWNIVAPPATVTTVGTLPTGIAISRDGTRAFVLETGHRKPALRILDTRTLQTLRTIPLVNAFGVPVRDANGDGVWIAGTITFGDQVAHVDTESGRIDRAFTLPAHFAPVAVAVTRDGSRLAVAGDLADRVAILDAHDGRILGLTTAGHHPAALAWDHADRMLYVANRGDTTVNAIDTVRGTPTHVVRTGMHPAALAIDAHDRLYVANTDDDDIAIVEGPTLVARVRIPWGTPRLVGASPNALTLDGDRLYVTCGAANAIAVFRRTAAGLAPLGAIPAGWYPTAVAVRDGALLVVNGKGESGHANPKYRPGTSGEDRGYVADNLLGSIRRLARPDDAGLRGGLAVVRQLDAPATEAPTAFLSPNGPIKHVVYVIKENRTYDQVLGDVSTGDGDASLVMYGENVTPNEHAIVRRFGLFDRFMEDSHVSADGHNWATAAFANDYLEHMWPANYASRRPLYDFEDGADAAVPHGGHIWDAAVERGRSLRDYGEYVTNGPGEDGTPVSTMLDALRSRIDPRFPTFDLDITDQTRFAEWKREFDRYEATRTLPQFEIVRFPNDHTNGTRKGKPTPRAMVADNDLAVGKLVEAISHSPDWASTAIFMVEDDAQDGPDHVDEQRSTFYLASPYAAGGTFHQHVTQASVLHTIEAILGLRSLSPYDANAPTLAFAFQPKADLTPYDTIAPKTDVNEKNGAVAYGSAISERLNFDREDHIDPATLNDVLWHDARGADATPPPYGAFSRR